MAKIYGLFGSMTGKLADVVMSVRNGEQIARKYQPTVFNPSTPAQIAQRAKLKLISQLSAALAPIIAMKREGSVSSRNLFTKRNFEYTAYVDGQADITLADVQLTNSVVPLAGFIVDRSGSEMTIELAENMGTSIDRVVYVVLKKTGGQEILIAESTVVAFSESGGTFQTSIPKVTGEIVVMAYGIRFNTEAARVTFGNMTVPTAQEVARLLVTTSSTEANFTLTETRGLQMASSENEATTPDALRVNINPRISALSTGTGTVSGGGRVSAGDEVTVTATPSSGSTFAGWYRYSDSTLQENLVSSLSTYTFTAGQSSTNLYAYFVTANAASMSKNKVEKKK